MKTFTKEEIKILKEIAQEKIRYEQLFLYDEKGRKIPYRNRFETWDDAYNNLEVMGFSHDSIIERIGEDGRK